MTLSVPISKVGYGQTLDLPAYQTSQSAGMDLMAAVGSEAVTLEPLQRGLIPAGIALALPAGFEAQVRPRSGLALKQGVTVLNSPGTIDADYRGEIGVILINLGDAPIRVEHGMRIAQLVIAPVVQAHWNLTETLPGSQRAQGGFGSTGV
ncbi:MAG: dUTP diphosphatase [Pseudomonadota bacterium]